MKINRYEAHITVDIAFAKEVQIAGHATGWTYSQIHDCPIMGNNTYCYLTHYNTNAETLKDQIDAIIALLSIGNIPILRAKIKQIIYDTKTGVNQL